MLITSSKRLLRRGRGLALILTLVCGLLPLSTPSYAMSEDEPKPAYRFGVFPYLPALTIDRLYGPMAEAFSFELDRLVKLRTKSTFESFADAIVEQSYDVLFVHPFFYVEAVDHHDYLPLARLDRSLTAVLVAADDSAIHDLDDLSGLTIGLPPKLAAVSHLIKSALIDQGVRPGLDIGIRHFRNKASCLQAMRSNAVAVCGVPEFILSEVEAFAELRLRTVFEAPPVNHFALAIHRRVPEAEREQLKALILAWNRDRSDGVDENGVVKTFVPIEETDYAEIREQKKSLQILAQR